LGSSVEVQLEDELYGAGGTALLARLRALPEQAESVLLIGHNPGVQDLLIELASDGDPARLDSVRAGVPPAHSRPPWRGSCFRALFPTSRGEVEGRRYKR
jgi:phosphohistidine phosphatase